MQCISLDEAALKIQEGKVGVIPTDTIYGVVGSALSPEVVERIYDVRGRLRSKPCIILISSADEVKKFDVDISDAAERVMEAYWPGVVSIILPCRGKSFSYLHREEESIAFRVPEKEELRAFLQKTGPIIAPSANPEGKPPATTVAEARDYFSESIDFYVDGGVQKGAPSTVLSIYGEHVKVVRMGRVLFQKET